MLKVKMRSQEDIAKDLQEAANLFEKSKESAKFAAMLVIIEVLVDIRGILDENSPEINIG